MRSIKKAIEEYDANFATRPGNEAKFFGDDIMQLYDMVEDTHPSDLLFMLANYALRAGFVIGHRKGMKDARKEKLLLQIKEGGVSSSDLSPEEWHLIQMMRQSDPGYAAIIYELMSEPLGPVDEPKLHVVGNDR